MSDFLARLAARAVGESSRARPRDPGLLEQTRSTTEAPLEVTEDVVVVSGRAGGGHGDDEPLSAERPIASASPPEAPVAEPTRSRPVVDAGARRVARPRSVARPASMSALDDVEREPDGPGVLERRVDTGARASASATPLPTAAVEMTPVVSALVPAREDGTVPVSGEARAQPPPVRVHIGRLEVRANLMEPARERPRREPSRGDELSLADYLRGKREA